MASITARGAREHPEDNQVARAGDRTRLSRDGPATRTAISANGLRKAYPGKPVLDGVDIDVAEGEVFALLGPNGAGKTTVVRILSTLIPLGRRHGERDGARPAP